MLLASQIVTGLVAALHVYFLVLEMFLWTTPVGQKAFARTREEQEASKVLAANQGLYNGFLAAGLVWSLVAGDLIALPIRTFFLGCVVVAGVYGGVTASKKILFVQAIPAAIGLAVTLALR
jgi:putative membrane protein